MSKLCIHYSQTPVGELILGDYAGQLVLCDWRFRKMRKPVDKRIAAHTSDNWIEHETELIQETKKQLNEYFSKERTVFNLPFRLIGSNFQQRVWDVLGNIPYGTTTTYMQLNKQLGDDKAVRAVASANGGNVFSIIVPCHRVIGSNGDFVGYAGGISTKKKLLQLEGALPQLELF